MCVFVCLCVCMGVCVCVCASKFPLGQQRERSSFESTSSFPSRFLLYFTLLSPANCPLFPPPGAFLLSLSSSISSISAHNPNETPDIQPVLAHIDRYPSTCRIAHGDTTWRVLYMGRPTCCYCRRARDKESVQDARMQNFKCSRLLLQESTCLREGLSVTMWQ